MIRKVTEIHPKKNKPFYRQEGKVGMYQIMLPFLTTGTPMLKWLPANWGESFGMFKNDYAEFYFYEESFRHVAKETLKVSDGDLPISWRKEIARLDTGITELSRKIDHEDLSGMSLDELRKRYDELYDVDQDMWAVLIFIDSFDSGVDQETIAAIQKDRNFSDDEIHMLLTPNVPAFVTSWEIALADLQKGKKTKESLKKDFFWYAVDYSHYRELTDEFINEEISKNHKPTYVSPTDAQKAILKKHNLNANPLQFFQNLAVWRDERKKLNYIGVYGLMKILREVFRRQNLPVELVNALLPQQVDDLFAEKLTQKQLELQLEGIFHYVSPKGEFSYAFGDECDRLWSDFKKVLAESEKGKTEVKGMAASRGIVSGTVRIIIDPHVNEDVMQKGDILVTSMTRPEFLPFMKKAGAFVTDEGGISCHAAIIARELGKPCIIGTRNATKILKDGDLVEVDADKGVVRIIKRDQIG